MEINPLIFKSYDIRGIYPSELNKKTAYEVGRAFAALTGARKIAVAIDARTSGPDLLKFISNGIIDSGADVLDIGRLPTECLYFSVGHYPEIEAGIMITASHNPKEYNGFKMLKKTGKDIDIISGKNMLSAVESLEENKTFPNKKGKILKKDILSDFASYIFSISDNEGIKPFSVVVDASNGVAGIAMPKIADSLPAKVFLLNHEPDGNFPNHSPNPLEEGSLNQIREEILLQKADFGFIFDGDADRIFLIDENGNMIRADVTLLIMAKYFLQKYPNSAIAYNAICSKAVPEFIEKWQGKPVKTQVGFVNVREGLVKNSGVMGGELSGHYCFKDNFYLDSGMMTFLILLRAISDSGKKVSELAAEFSPYAKSSEINFKVADKLNILSAIKQKYSDGRQDFLDGITIEYPDWWFNARPSNTEPLLRLTIEAETSVLLDIKKKELIDFITSFKG